QGCSGPFELIYRSGLDNENVQWFTLRVGVFPNTFVMGYVVAKCFRNQIAAVLVVTRFKLVEQVSDKQFKLLLIETGVEYLSDVLLCLLFFHTTLVSILIK